jgi:hypothetical protein
MPSHSREQYDQSEIIHSGHGTSLSKFGANVKECLVKGCMNRLSTGVRALRLEHLLIDQMLQQAKDSVLSSAQLRAKETAK